MGRSISSEFGQIKIHRKAIRQLVEAVAVSVKGVHKVGWKCYGKINGFFLKFFEIGGTKITYEKEFKIVIPITVLFGENLVDVASEVQREIAENIKKNLDLENVIVDVKIKRIEKGEK
ncbi:MAG: Asp23/Gls24 family envelope stress response protein [Candidatus Omnitrophica bacterium]|nr:Asp23/Gls24 family envelope stress response protein [Candidatus Omnitrophota bacterium]